MGSTKAFRKPGASSFDGSKMLSYKQSNTTTNAAVKPHLTIQERLQDISIIHWHQPIDEALDLHLHGHLTLTSNTLATDSWKKWPKNYCRAMIQLVQLVPAAQTNELLTVKMAAEGFPDRDIGTQPKVIREVVLEVRKRVGPGDGGTGKKVTGSHVRKTNDTVRGAKVRGHGKRQRGGKKGKI